MSSSTTEASSASGLLGLKIKRRWLNKMKTGSKMTEVRKYKPDDCRFLPQEVKSVGPGTTFALLSEGVLEGFADLEAVDVYASADDLRRDIDQHAISAAKDLDMWERKLPLYAWRLVNLRWLAAPLQSGTGGTPNFKGQAHGQVWARCLFSCDLLALPTTTELGPRASKQRRFA